MTNMVNLTFKMITNFSKVTPLNLCSPIWSTLAIHWYWKLEMWLEKLKKKWVLNFILFEFPLTSWQIDRETMVPVTDLIFLGSKITANGDCSREIKRCLLLQRKAMTKLDNILKSRDVTLPTKVCLVKAMVFPVVLCGCESWTIKKAECWRIDAFELWCWRRLLRVPWTVRRSVNPKGDQPWIIIGRTDAEAEAPILWSPDMKSLLI